MEVPVTIQEITPVVTTGFIGALIVFKEENGERVCAMSIGATEATAIALALQGVEPPRPQTHDFLRNVIVALGGKVEKLVITDLKPRNTSDGIYYAEIHLKQGDKTIIVDVRPSDGTAEALRFQAPILVNEELLRAPGGPGGEGKLPSDPDGTNVEDLLKEIDEKMGLSRS